MTRRRRALAWVIAPALVAQLATAPTAAARREPTAGPVTTLSSQGYAPVTVVDGEGTATVVWAAHYWRGPIRAARRPAGEGWSAPVTIGRGTNPVIGIDAAGVVTVLFSTNRRGFTTGLSAVRREPGRPWGRPKHLTNDRPAERYGPNGDEGIFGAHRADLAVSPGGDVVAVWQWGSDHRHRPYRIEAARRPDGGRWSEPRALTRRDWSSDPEIGVDQTGRATLVYHQDGSLVSRRLIPGDGWSGRVRLRGDAAVVDSDLVVTPDGDTTLMLHVYGRQDGALAVMQRPPTGPWTGTRQLSPDGVVNIAGAVAAHGNGSVTVAWIRTTGRVDAVTWTDGTWLPPFQVTGAAQNRAPQLAGSSTGDLVVWWQNESLGIRARVRDAAGSWTSRFGMWPDARYYGSSAAAVYPDGDVLSVVHRAHRRDDDIRVRRVRVD